MHKYTLEKYRTGGNRQSCPNCGASKTFVRYVDQSGSPLGNTVGRCNRESKCGYHYAPRAYFADNSQGEFKPNSTARKRSKQLYTVRQGFASTNAIRVTLERTTADFIETSVLLESLANYERNAFVQFLLTLFEKPVVEDVLKRYFVGTWTNARTVFWQLDARRRIRTGKLIAYDAETGKRRKLFAPSFIHAELKRAGKLKTDFALEQCFFGEHLTRLESHKPLAIVEAEKTAVIAAICLPSFVWLASAGKSNLTAARLERFGARKIVLFPDADGFERWQQIAENARLRDLNVIVSDLIERCGATNEKQNGFDLADYLTQSAKFLLEQTKDAVTKILSDAHLTELFEIVCEERAAIMEIDGGIENAFDLITETETFRQLSIEFAAQQCSPYNGFSTSF